MRTTTGRTLLVFAIVLLVAGFVVISPTGGFPVLVLATLLAGASSLLLSKKLSLLSLVVFIACLAAAICRYREFIEDYGSYVKHAKESAISNTTSKPAANEKKQ
jgi:hypothetical protein